MKKFIISAVFALLTLSVASALEVDERELRSAGENQTIEFINYEGPHKVIDSLASIKGIGSSLGTVVSKDVQSPAETGSKSKYYVIHAIDPNETGKLDADILFLGADAQVDHIRNLRHIIASYLSSAYGYSEKDAETVAVFITVYNAVYRSDLDSFSKKYKSVVTKNLSKDNCGLSVTYKDWPGKSEIVIPLYDVNAGISTVDTSVISDTKVVDSMKEDDDKNIEARKDMVDLKEREAEQAEENARDAQKQAVAEQKKLDEEKQKTAQAEKKAEETKKEAEQAQKQADEAKAEAEANPDDEQKQAEAEQAQKQADEAQAEAEQAEEELENQREAEAEQQQKTDEAREEASEQQSFADRKTTEAQSERKEIAKDQKEVQKREAEEAKMDTEFGIVLVDEQNLLSRLVKFNKANGDTLKNSPITTIRNRTAYKAGDGFVAIAGENVNNGTIKLVVLDSETMEISAESNEVVYETSVLVNDGADFYCVIVKDDKCYLAKFDAALTLKLQSTIEVLGATPVMLTSSGIVVTDSNGKMKVLDKATLNVIQ